MSGTPTTQQNSRQHAETFSLCSWTKASWFHVQTAAAHKRITNAGTSQHRPRKCLERKASSSGRRTRTARNLQKLKTRVSACLYRKLSIKFATVHFNQEVSCRSPKLSDVETSSVHGQRHNTSSPPPPQENPSGLSKRERDTETSTHRKVIFDLVQDP